MTFRVLSATLASIICFLLGLFVYLRDPRRPMNRNFFGFNIGLSAWAIGDLLVTLAYTSNRYHLALWFDRFSYIGAIIVAPFFMLQLSSLVESSNQGIHKVITKSIYASSFALIALTLTPWVIEDVTLNPFSEKYGPLFLLVMAYFVGGLCYGIFHLWMAYRSTNGVRRSRIKYFAIAVFIGLIGAIVYFVSLIHPKFPPIYYYLEISYALVVAYAILAHRLMDISVIIRKTLIYSAVMTVLAIVYMGIVAIFTNIFKGLAGYQAAYTSFIAASLVTIGFQPLRKKVQTFVDTKFFRDYVDREEKLYELSREVITHTTPEAMGGALMRVLNDTLHPKTVALYLRSKNNSGFTRVSEFGSATSSEHMDEENDLATYFADHSQPFVHDLAAEMGRSHDTRLKSEREDAA